MFIPSLLKTGSKIAILSPSGAVNPEFVKSAVKLISDKGYEPVVFPSCLNKHFQFGGTDEQRLADLQSALDDENFDAILCSRGGYGAIRILDKLNFGKFMNKPKWIIGFSDITNLHLALNRVGVVSIHGNMVKEFHENPESDTVKNIFEILTGNPACFKIESHLFNKHGNAGAELIGGNLSIIYSLQATEFEIDTEGKILFIEDLNEYLYHLDRIMINLKLSGKLKNLKGLIAGAFTDMKDNPNPFGKTAYEIIREHVEEYDFPVCFNFPSGHINNNLPWVHGMTYKFNVASDGVELKPVIRS